MDFDITKFKAECARRKMVGLQESFEMRFDWMPAYSVLVWDRVGNLYDVFALYQFAEGSDDFNPDVHYPDSVGSDDMHYLYVVPEISVLESGRGYAFERHLDVCGDQHMSHYNVGVFEGKLRYEIDMSLGKIKDMYFTKAGTACGVDVYSSGRYGLILGVRDGCAVFEYCLVGPTTEGGEYVDERLNWHPSLIKASEEGRMVKITLHGYGDIYLDGKTYDVKQQ